MIFNPIDIAIVLISVLLLLADALPSTRSTAPTAAESVVEGFTPPVSGTEETGDN